MKSDSCNENVASDGQGDRLEEENEMKEKGKTKIENLKSFIRL